MKPVTRFLSGALLISCAFAGDDLPNWLRELSSAKTGPYPSKVPAVVLLDEENVTVDDNGRVTTSNRKAIKVLTREGRKDAVARKVYVTGTGKIRDMRAWMIRPSGDVKKYGKDAIVDLALAANDIYNESRMRAVLASDDADPGAVFGYESVTEDRSIFSQFEWSFQEHLPALLSRFVVNVPSGWRAEGVVFNGKVTPQVAGSTYTWEYRDLPFIEEEPASPSLAALAPRVAVSYFPAEGAKATPGKIFHEWPDVAQWLAELEDPQSAPTPEIAEKAQALVSGAKTELDRIRAIGHYVQTVKYVSIQIGLGRGGGYRPHTAAQVFQKQYGDCKDKSNLMRSMLKAAGIPSYMVSIWAGDPGYVRDSWPSPHQFNHAIIAVKLTDAASSSPATIEHPQLGRLLFFDPTDENTPLGDLPDHEQGSFALIDATTANPLIRMPVIPAAANRVERETEVTLAADGSIVSKLSEKAYGQSAAVVRRRFRSQASGDFTKWVERWITSGANAAAVTKVQPVDDFAGQHFDLQLEFKSERYAQSMRGRLLVFRPSVVTRRGTLLFSEVKRQNPVRLDAETFQETVRVKLPVGFKIDEMPDGGKLETPFGTYTASYQTQGDELVFARKLEIRAATVPVEQYPELKKFFERVAGSEQSPVVLAKE